MPPVEINDSIALTPYQKYQLALQSYAANNPQTQAAYEQYGQAPQQGAGGSVQGILPAAIIGGKLAASGGTAAAVAPAAPTLLGASAIPSAASAGTAAAPVAASSLGALPLAGIALAAGIGGKGIYNLIKGKDPSYAQRGVLGVATGGLSEVARHFLNHKTTRQVAQDHTKDLLSQGTDNSPWQAYVNAMRGQYNAPPPDPSKPFAGKYGSWDEYQKAGLDASDLTGVYGNLKTFGPDWASKSFDQQKAITQGIIDAGLYNSKKGEVEITDPERAKQIAASSIQALLAKPLGAAPIRKDSPGFKDGKRIDYGAKK